MGMEGLMVMVVVVVVVDVDVFLCCCVLTAKCLATTLCAFHQTQRIKCVSRVETFGVAFAGLFRFCYPIYLCFQLSQQMQNYVRIIVFDCFSVRVCVFVFGFRNEL